MLTNSRAFSSFSVNDIDKAKEFYGSTLGIETKTTREGLELHVAGGGIPVFIYEKKDHVPAIFTVLNFLTDDIGRAVDEITAKGIAFERYEGMDADEKGIMWSEVESDGPSIAWFKDPAGNVIAVIQGDKKAA